jgi:hypothetical protein
MHVALRDFKAPRSSAKPSRSRARASGNAAGERRQATAARRRDGRRPSPPQRRPLRKATAPTPRRSLAGSRLLRSRSPAQPAQNASPRADRAPPPPGNRRRKEAGRPGGGTHDRDIRRRRGKRPNPARLRGLERSFSWTPSERAIRLKARAYGRRRTPAARRDAQSVRGPET